MPNLPGQITPIVDEVGRIAPGVVIVQLSDNFAESLADRETFYTPYHTLLTEITAISDAQVVCVGTWSPESVRRDAFISEAAAGAGATFVPISDLYSDPVNRAISEGECTDASVCWHPGDQGMERIAERIIRALD